MTKLYGLYGPSGKFRGAYADIWSAWCSAFDYQNEDFRAKYWKRVEPSRRAMRKLGWRVVAGRFLPNVRHEPQPSKSNNLPT